MNFRWFALSTLCLGLSTPAFGAADAVCVGKTGQTGTYTRTLNSGGIARTYRLDVPQTYNPTQGTPLIFNFHGLGDNAENFATGTGMATEGTRAGYIVVHANGYQNSWNAGTCCGQAAMDDIDDVQFVRDMIADLNKDYCLDANRVFSSGFSNGGYFSHRLGCEANDIIAAITPVSGLIAVDCQPERAVPVHQSHGSSDPIVFYNRGEEDIALWAALNGCDEAAATYYNKGNATCIRYPNCSSGADVELCTLRFVGHKWVRSNFYDTTLENIKFFTEHPMP